MESLPTPMIQATRCLLYAAAGQAIEQQQAGLAPLDEGTDRWIHRRALSLL
jgi:hypothetical protein